MQPHRWQPTRLPRPWDSPGKNTGVGHHFLLQCMKVKSESEVTQSCLTPSDPMDCRLPGSSVHGIFQARVLEWGANAFLLYILYIWISTLNINGLSVPSKRHRLADAKTRPYICCLYETHITPRDTYRLKVSLWKKRFHVTGNQKKARVAIVIWDKMDFKIKIITGDKAQ